METETNGKTLTDALAVLKRYAGSRALIPAGDVLELRTVDDGNAIVLRRYATKTETDVTASIYAKTFTHGTAYVRADALADAIKGTKGAVMLAADGERLTVTADGRSASVPLADGAAFPDAPAFPWTTLADVTPSETDALASVLKAAAKGYDARAVLTGVYFDGSAGIAVTTDTYRMHVAKLRNLRGSAIIAADVLRIALATTSGTVGLGIGRDDDTRYTLHYASTKGPKAFPRVIAFTVAGRTIEGPFPNYDAIVRPAETDALTSWTVRDAAGTASVLRTFTNTKNVPAILAPAGSAVRVTAAFGPGDTREAVAPVDASADPFDGDGVAFNPSYLADAIAHGGDGAPVFLRDRSKAALIGSTDGDAYALVMPMRVA